MMLVSVAPLELQLGNQKHVANTWSYEIMMKKYIYLQK